MKVVDRESIAEKIASVTWFHTWEIVPGVRTPGLWDFDPKAALEAFAVPADLTGKTALDIGTYDGPIAFELEARGCDVTALDIRDPDATGFNVSKSILDSSVRYVRGSVYDLSRLLADKYDLVFFLGVYYHLKHPILAFDQINGCLKDNGILYFSGECLINYSESLDGEAHSLDVEALAKSNVPITLCYPRRFKNSENWFVPNVACLNSWLIAAGFEKMTDMRLVENRATHPYPTQRVAARANKKSSPILEHPLLEDHWRPPIR